MNHLKTGTILRVPQKEHVIETVQSEAVKEIHLEAANWNTYRRTLAEMAEVTAARESRSTASGRITTAVDDKAAAGETPKEVLKLSKGEPTAPGAAGGGKGTPRRPADRLRTLEEEMIARENALAETNDRIAQLEKTIKDMQRLLEIKGQVPGAAEAKPPPQPTRIAQAAPDLIYRILDEPLYLAAGTGLIALLGGAGYGFARRRRTQLNK
jgi:pilus assembly protein FimV